MFKCQFTTCTPVTGFFIINIRLYFALSIALSSLISWGLKVRNCATVYASVFRELDHATACLSFLGNEATHSYLYILFQGLSATCF